MTEEKITFEQFRDEVCTSLCLGGHSEIPDDYEILRILRDELRRGAKARDLAKRQKNTIRSLAKALLHLHPKGYKPPR